MNRRTAALWLRWSWRDLRRRWLQLAITALVIALGTGLFAGLSSVARWRMMSNDASFELTRFHDLHARLSTGSFANEGALIAAAGDGPWAAMEERLVVPTKVRTTVGGEALIVPGRIVGYGLSDVKVDVPYVAHGRPLRPGDAGRPTVLIERNFAKHYDLGDEGDLELAGGLHMQFVGHAMAPEYFFVVTDEAGLLAEANFAVVFTSIETAREAAGLPGKVNDLVVRLEPGAGRAERDAAAALLRERLAPLGATVIIREDEEVYRLLTEDARGDQQVYTVLATAILAGAVFAAFNITSRMVEAQRREFGIAMALGVPPWRIALRPLLVGLQIALLGVVFGIGVGLLVGWAMGNLLRTFLTLPIIETPFQPGIFAAVAAGGLAAPMVAIAYPVWRAVRVPPIRAIRTGHVAVRPPGLARLAGRVPLPGDTFVRMPLRNLLRAPRRALLTGLGIAAIIAVLVALLGYLDSFFGALDRAEAETASGEPGRLEIDLDRFYPLDGPEAAALLASPAITAPEPRLRVGATLMGGGEQFDVLLELTDFTSQTWRPSVQDGALPAGNAGIVIGEAAARDLGVRIGDTITVRHPVRSADGSFALVESSVPVAATHGHPLRIYAYMDLSQASLLGLQGQANRFSALPASSDIGVAREALFALAGVASVQEAAASVRLLRDRFDQFIGILYVMEGGLLLLAALIAYNTASISLDERAREHATMLAYGVRPRTVMRVAVVEGLLLGALSTLLGFVGGYILARWFVHVLARRVVPDIGLDLVLSPASAVLVVVLGVLAVGITPLFGWRRLRRMDVPSTLRLME